MRSYNSYHTTLKQLAKKDRLQDSYKNELNRTTLWRWKKEPENNNSKINELTNNNTIRLNKLIALKNIPFSNSLIEAQNKLLKYRYLFRQEYSKIEELRKLLEWNN